MNPVKKEIKKIALSICLALLGSFSPAQNGLEKIIVEKYYVSNAADSIQADVESTNNGFPTGALPVGSVTYRFYADMAPGYKLLSVYADKTRSQSLIFTTTTHFYNNPTGTPSPVPGTAKSAIKNKLLALDSYISLGAVATSNYGILKSEDPGGSGTNAINITVASNPAGVLLNNLAPMDAPALTVQDGMYNVAPAPQNPAYAGFTAHLDSVLGDGSAFFNSFLLPDGSCYATTGAVGPIPATNRVLIAQITTDGVLHYELNVLVQLASGGAGVFFAAFPGAGDFTHPSLKGTLGAVNALPSVSIDAPLNGANFIVGGPVPIVASASDADGTIASVQFYVDGASVGTDNTGSPNYDGNWPVSTLGTHTLTAIATDDQGGTKTSSQVIINVVSNPLPVVIITAPANGSSSIFPDEVAITATATDNGSISAAGVTFLVDGTVIGSDISSPYTFTWTPLAIGTHTITARATDDLGASGTSSNVVVSVVANQAPTVSITDPPTGSSTTSALVPVTASASDPDGTIASVEFFANGTTSLGLGTLTGPGTYTISVLSGDYVNSNLCLTAKAADNRGAQSTSTQKCIFIQDANAAYRIATIDTTCHPATFCLSVISLATVTDVVGYDMVLQYVKTKVKPIGVSEGNMIPNAAANIDYYIDTAAGRIAITYFFTGARTTEYFSGANGSQVLCVQFQKLAGFTSVDEAAFSMVGSTATGTLDESYFSGVVAKEVSSGKYITHKNSYFHGKLKYWANNGPLRSDNGEYLNTGVFPCNSLTPSSQADSLGNFSYTINDGLNIKIKRDILNSTDVQPIINGADAVLARKIILNDPSFVPNVYNMISSDVNLDKKVSAGDISQINQRAVLMIGEYVQTWNHDSNGNKIAGAGPSSDWLFADTSVNFGAFSNNNVPVVDTCYSILVNGSSTCPEASPSTYSGILLGDVNGSFSGSRAFAKKMKTDAGKIIFDLSKAEIINGHVDIPVSISSLDAINAADFALQFNEANIAFNSMIDGSGILQSSAYYNPADKTLRFTASSLQGMEKNKTFLSVRFDVLSGTTVQKSDFSSMRGLLNGNPANVVIYESAVANTIDFRIYPNPAKDVLNVEVGESAMVQMLDISGKQIIAEARVNANEKYEINTLDIASGIYLIKIYNDSFLSIQKVVIAPF